MKSRKGNGVIVESFRFVLLDEIHAQRTTRVNKKLLSGRRRKLWLMVLAHFLLLLLFDERAVKSEAKNSLSHSDIFHVLSLN